MEDLAYNTLILVSVLVCDSVISRTYIRIVDYYKK